MILKKKIFQKMFIVTDLVSLKNKGKPLWHNYMYLQKKCQASSYQPSDKQECDTMKDARRNKTRDFLKQAQSDLRLVITATMHVYIEDLT